MLLSPNLLAEGQPRYISDNVFLYILNGPGTEYRILGSIEAGQPITLQGESQGDYSKIVDHKGREGWIQTNLISDTPSFREQVPTLTNELATVKAKLDEVLSTKDDGVDQVAELQSKVSELESTLSKTVKERDNLKVAADRSADEARYAMWREGAVLGGIGLLLGVLLVYIPRPQRRNKKRWM
ncbi:TIGR04211 family SH3 domain-containing protein [Shewanella acanthi]|uniref:TIGR04211 family SH3 domain-containing protein n=1 Tax=Shewanella acanthi TaxID=2864212 RepID=UPI001C65D836|nr:TIGR04211 family SH3 domain-containing protein [Shewanella acanthi]QYJ80526.1 TIGR04211 family SH3 domain-containing protein [Shewanella acanthi]